MTLQKIENIDQIEIVGPYKIVQVRKATIILEDGNEISKTFDRNVVKPGDDPSKFGNDVVAICAIVHTPEIVSAYQEKVAKELAEMQKVEG